MKTVILCGGRGTRLGEHGKSVPKALITIGGKPILWHLLKLYSHYGIKEFILCLGFLGDEIKEYFQKPTNDWTIDFIDTGLDTNTGGRLKSIENLLANDKTFCVTYGDGLADLDLRQLIDFHHAHGKVATVTTVHPFSSFGLVDINDDGTISRFREKPLLPDWINGGFFVFEREIFKQLKPDSILEREPFEILSGQSEMMAFRHEGFWKCMDTFKDNLEFEKIWNNSPPWKVW